MSDNNLIRRGDAMREMWKHANGKTVLGGQTYQSLTLEVALDAIAALPAATVGVKPLVWEASAINKPWHSAKAPWGWYYAQWDDETQAWFASLEMGEVEAPIILSPSDVPSIQAAKAAAQADYEARVLAALEPVAAPRRYMGQIMAECDCSRQGECEAAQKCLAVAAPVTQDKFSAVDHMSRVADTWMHKAEGLQREIDMLTNPVTVHANMLRGTIARPTVEQIIHLYGVDALAKALAPVIVREAGIEPLAAPDPTAIREAALREALKALDSLPEYGSPDVNIGVSNAYSAILALIQKRAAEPTEYERKVAQMKKDFPNGI